MASEDKESPPTGNGSSRHISPPPGLRHRPLGRATTFAEPSKPLNRRRSSNFSESMSDAKRSLRSSTDDLLFPRISPTQSHPDAEETTHWHSLPLGLALLPAVGGMVFKDGSAVITDVTLLGLAAIFMNWALRVPWEWYHTSQASFPAEYSSSSAFSPIQEEDEDDPLGQSLTSDVSSRPQSPPDRNKPVFDQPALDAQSELRLHEFLALISCFVCPLLAAWLLHGIRSQLSRPSEGLVSNYNLTIFLLVAEIRPISHLIKMIQKRTLFLQRHINLDALQDHTKADRIRVEDLIHRMEELEAHVSNAITSKDTSTGESSEVVAAKASSQASSELRRSLQPEIDAISRAMRRYEKRSTISAVSTETRIQDLETRVKDVVVLAAAAQRHADEQSRSYVLVLTNWLCALVVVPVEYLQMLLSLPYRFLSSFLAIPKRYLSSLRQSRRPREAKSARRVNKGQAQDREKRARPSG